MTEKELSELRELLRHGTICGVHDPKGRRNYVAIDFLKECSMMRTWELLKQLSQETTP